MNNLDQKEFHLNKKKKTFHSKPNEDMQKKKMACIISVFEPRPLRFPNWDLTGFLVMGPPRLGLIIRLLSQPLENVNISCFVVVGSVPF